MWSPTHVLITVGRARNLLTKGKNDCNDSFVVIKLGKEKSRTSVKLKSSPNVEWNEECELSIPVQGNKADVILTVFHQNFTGDEFLGTVSLPLSSFDVYQQPRAKWYPLKSKAGQENKTKYRGDIEVAIAFTVKSGSMLDLSKKDKMRDSLGQLSNAAHSFGGSLLNLGTKEKKRLKTLASSVNNKLKFSGRGRSSDEKNDSHLDRSASTISDGQSFGDIDPGIISDEDDFHMSDLSRHSSSNLTGNQSPADGSLENVNSDVFRFVSSAKGKNPVSTTGLDSSPRRVVLGREMTRNDSGSSASSNPRASHQSLHSDKSREELIAALQERDQQIKDLNDYIDSLLLKVMNTCPTVLQHPGKGRTVTRRK